MKRSIVFIILSLTILIHISHVSAYDDDIYSEDDLDLRRKHTQRRGAGADEEAAQAEKAEREEEERKRRERERASFTSPRGGNEQEEYMRMTITSCIWLTKIKMTNSQKDLSLVSDVFKTNTKSQTGVFKKITGELMETCFQNINIETAKRFLEEANKEKEKFDFASFEFVFKDWTHKKYLNKNVDLTLSNDQEALYKYVEEFEKMMAEREGKNPQDGSPAQGQEEEDYFYKPKPEDSEPRIFGISLKLDSPALQLVYVGAFVALVVFIIYYGLKQIQLMNQPLQKKLKKDKKRK